MPSWICRLPFLNINHHLHRFPIFGSVSLVSFSTSTPKISILDYLVNHHNFSPECASNVASSSSTHYIKKPQRADSVLNFLKEIGFSKDHIEALVRKGPWLLSAYVETTIKPKIRVLEDLRIHSTDFADMIIASPLLLHSSADRLRRSIFVLKNVLGANADFCRLFKKAASGRFLKYDLERTFVPNVEYLKSCEICSFQIASFIYQFPLVFLTKPEKFERTVKRVDAMGVNRGSKVFLCAVRVMSTMSREMWELKLNLFRELGFSEQNIFYAFRVYPKAFNVSERKIKEVTDLLFSVEGLGISEIVTNPVLLTRSVEKRLKPRVRVYKALQNKNLLKQKPSFAAFCQISDTNFMNKYVIPYSNELGDLCLASQGSSSTDSDVKFST